MSDKEIIDKTIEDYTRLQRIMKSPDPRKEIKNQKRFVEAKLQAFGVVTEKLEGD